MKTLLIVAGILGVGCVVWADAPATNTTSIPSVTASVPAGEGMRPLPRIQGPISVDEAVRLALKNSPVIRGALAEIDMAQAQVTAARAGFKPSLSATTFATVGSEAGPIYSTPQGVMPQNLYAVSRGPFVNQNLMLMWPLATGGRLQALLRQAQAARAASTADFDAVRLDLVLEVKTAYRQVLLAQAMAGVARDRQKATAERLKNDIAAAEAGRVPQLYALRDQAEDADAQQEVTNAERDAELAFVMLRAAMGADQNSSFTLADNLDVTIPTVSADTIESALKQRPEIRAALNRLENTRRGLDAARSASRPQIAFSAMADVNRMRGGSNAGGGASAGLVLGVPIFDRGVRRSEREASTASAAKAQADLDRIRLQVDREVQGAGISLNAATKNVAAAQAAVTAAEESYRVAVLRYESGRGTNVELLDALAALTRARGAMAQAKYQALGANDQLARATGQPIESSSLEQTLK